MIVVTRDRKARELYSARKYSTKGVELISVMNPATSSLSASGKSKGVREVSARAETKNIGKAGKSWAHKGCAELTSHSEV